MNAQVGEGIALSMCDLAVGYGPKRVLAGIDLVVRRGEWFCLLGPNGSGKTTLLRAVSGQLTPSRGSIAIGGESLERAPVLAKRRLGFAHPPDALPGLLTGRQCLEVYAGAYGLAHVGPGILELAEAFRLTAALERFVDTYSLGMRQKLSALLALVGEPELIVLDEAFNGLDAASALVLKRCLTERIAGGRCAVVLATHALDIVVRHATGAALLFEGGIIRSWSGAEFDALRGGGAEALEAELVSAMAEGVAA